VLYLVLWGLHLCLLAVGFVPQRKEKAVNLPISNTFQRYIGTAAHLCGGFSTHIATPMPSHLPPTWVTLWLAFTSLIVCWDAGWTLLPGARDAPGLLATIYSPYRATYSKLDMFYASDADFARVVGGANAFGPAQTALNVAEIAAQLVYLYLALLAQSPAAAVVGLCVSMATLSKTVLYFVMVYYYGIERMLVGTTSQRILLFLIPNGIWSAWAGRGPPSLGLLSHTPRAAHTHTLHPRARSRRACPGCGYAGQPADCSRSRRLQRQEGCVGGVGAVARG
jgi:hypothetical protein